MAIYKRGKIYWYKFMWEGKLIRESTKQGNDKVARQIEAAHRTSLAKGEVGIREKKPIPTLAEFCDKRVEPWAKMMFESTSPNNWYWFRAGIRQLRAYEPLVRLKLTEITNERAAEFASYELGRTQRHQNVKRKGMAVSSVNSVLRVLRRCLNLAVEWGVLEVAPTIHKLPGERRRERVITSEDEARYLAAAPPS